MNMHSLVSTAAHAWNCDEHSVVNIMQQIMCNMRQLHFEAPFWESVVLLVGHRAAMSQQQLPPEFWEALATTFAQLCAEDLALMRLNFVRYPIVGDDVWQRSVLIGYGTSMLVFRFAGAGRDADVRAGHAINIIELQF